MHCTDLQLNPDRSNTFSASMLSNIVLCFFPERRGEDGHLGTGRVVLCVAV